MKTQFGGSWCLRSCCPSVPRRTSLICKVEWASVAVQGRLRTVQPALMPERRGSPDRVEQRPGASSPLRPTPRLRFPALTYDGGSWEGGQGLCPWSSRPDRAPAEHCCWPLGLVAKSGRNLMGGSGGWAEARPWPSRGVRRPRAGAFGVCKKTCKNHYFTRKRFIASE